MVAGFGLLLFCNALFFFFWPSLAREGRDNNFRCTSEAECCHRRGFGSLITNMISVSRYLITLSLIFMRVKDGERPEYIIKTNRIWGQPFRTAVVLPVQRSRREKGRLEPTMFQSVHHGHERLRLGPGHIGQSCLRKKIY